MKTITVKLTIDQWEANTTLEALGNLDRYIEMDYAIRIRNKISRLEDVEKDKLSDEVEDLYGDISSLLDYMEETQGISDNSQIDEIVTEVFEQAIDQ